jgi:hypothetical protein
MWQTAITIGIVALAALFAVLYIRRMIQGRSVGCECGQESCSAGGNHDKNSPVNDHCQCASNACSECGTK